MFPTLRSWYRAVDARLEAWLIKVFKIAPPDVERGRQASQLAAQYGWWVLGIDFALAAVAAWSLNRLDPATAIEKWFFVALIVLIAVEFSLFTTYFGIRQAECLPGGERRFWRRWFIGLVLGLAGGFTGALIGATMGSDRTVLDVVTSPRVQGVAGLITVGIIISTMILQIITRLRIREANLQAELAEKARDTERLARETGDAQLRLLQAQVEPHFLYNTLANLRYLVESRSPDALAMVDHLIDYLRVSLPSFRSETVTVQAEFDLVQSYMAIMAIRLAGSFRHQIDLPAPVASHTIPPLMVLTLVENAIKHGVTRTADGGDITVRGRLDDDLIVIDVVDTGAGLGASPSNTAKRGSGVGLNNVRERLTARYGDAGVLTLQANHPRGVIATLVVPAVRAGTLPPTQPL
jgi:hypothetical protein